MLAFLTKTFWRKALKRNWLVATSTSLLPQMCRLAVRLACAADDIVFFHTLPRRVMIAWKASVWTWILLPAPVSLEGPRWRIPIISLYRSRIWSRTRATLGYASEIIVTCGHQRWFYLQLAHLLFQRGIKLKWIIQNIKWKINFIYSSFFFFEEILEWGTLPCLRKETRLGSSCSFIPSESLCGRTCSTTSRISSSSTNEAISKWIGLSRDRASRMSELISDNRDDLSPSLFESLKITKMYWVTLQFKLFKKVLSKGHISKNSKHLKRIIKVVI